jgi:hypothetical protein
MIVSFLQNFLKASSERNIPVKNGLFEGIGRGFLPTFNDHLRVGFFQLLNQIIVLGLLIIIQEKHILKTLLQALWDHLKQRFCDFELEPLDYHLLKGAFEISPRQVTFVKQIDYQIENRLDVVPSRFVISTA